MIVLTALAASVFAGSSQRLPAETPEWRENVVLVQMVLSHGAVAGLNLRSTPPWNKAILVVPFVLKGTAFRLNGKPWNSVPWLTKAQRKSENYLEFHTLFRKVQGTVYEGPRADVGAFFPAGNNHFDANFSYRNGAWKMNTMSAGIE